MGLHYNVFAYILITAFCRLHYPTGLHYNVFKITPFHRLHVCQLSAFSRPMQFNHNLSINVSLSPPCPTMHVQALGSPFSWCLWEHRLHLSLDSSHWWWHWELDMFAHQACKPLPWVHSHHPMHSQSAKGLGGFLGRWWCWPSALREIHTMTGVRSWIGLNGSVGVRMGSSRTNTTNGVTSEVRVCKYR